MAKGIRSLCLASCLTGVASLCAAGVLGQMGAGKYCCPQSCGQCGGRRCDSRGENCCIGSIAKSKKICQKEDDTGCKIPPSPSSPASPPSPRARLTRQCVNGVTAGGVCCPHSCRTCGRGVGCHFSGRNTWQCCEAKIRKSGKTCQKESDTACILQKFATSGAVALPESGLSMWSSAIAAGMALLFTLAGVLRWQRTQATAATCDGTTEQTAEQTPPLLE